jgi:uncharacterized cupin superfamily protein
MIDFKTFGNLASMDLGTLVPKATSTSGNQVEITKMLWQSDDGLLQFGVWECTPGRFTATKDRSSETCYIVSGKVSLHGEDGEEKVVSAGEVLVLPLGWKGEWTIHEQTRKMYVLHFPAT